MRISRKPYLKDLEAETVVVHTRDDASIRGVLVAVHSDVYVLRHAAYLNPDGSKVVADGEVLIPASRVAFLQRILETGDA
jgi:small nuclear ribonucleoprotein (snRNP)-like protein